MNRRSAILFAAGGVAAGVFPGACAVQGTPDRLAGDPAYRHALWRSLSNRMFQAIYAERNFAPIWIGPDFALNTAGVEVQRLLRQAQYQGVDVGVEPAEWEDAQQASPTSAGRREAGLSKAFATLAECLRTPPAGDDLIWTVPNLRPWRPSAVAALDLVAKSSDPKASATQLLQMHPAFYAMSELVRRLENGDSRLDPARHGGRTALRRKLATNLARLRSLPAPQGSRHLLVNVPQGRLEAYEDDRLVHAMKVIVGRRETPTPMMAGAIQYAVLNPYWNIPQDLLRDRIAPAVLRGGPEVFHARRLEALSDWSDGARILQPETLDWSAVADGRQRVRVRQKPGPDNMMGGVKFMLPNDLGIYLHDTPDDAAFERADHAASAGCVRVQNPEWLFRWLFRHDASIVNDGSPEKTVPLTPPTPVYLIYQTVTASPTGGVDVWPDIYGHDG